jgi:hypothetical protein
MKMLNILIAKEMQIKITFRHHLIPVRMDITLKTKIANANEDTEKGEQSHTAGENVNQYSHYGKQFGGSSKN